jgi:hypothetical protein
MTVWGQEDYAATQQIVVPAEIRAHWLKPRPTHFRIAWIIPSPDPSGITAAQYQTLDDLRQFFEAAIPQASDGLMLAAPAPALFR